VIVDFKSSAVDDAEKADKRAAESLQLKLYALAYGLAHGKTPGAVELQFIESGVVGRALVGEETLAEARTCIATASAGIRARAFDATPGYLECGYCAYNAICPAKSRGPQG
jgi:hypothetical protein